MRNSGIMFSGGEKMSDYAVDMKRKKLKSTLVLGSFVVINIMVVMVVLAWRL